MTLLNSINPFSDGEGRASDPGQLLGIEGKIPVEQGTYAALAAREMKVAAHPASIQNALAQLKLMNRLMAEAHSGTANTALNASYNIIRQIRRIYRTQDTSGLPKIDMFSIVNNTLTAASTNQASQLESDVAYMELKLFLQD